MHRLTIYGKGGPFGKKSKRRIVPMTNRITPLLESYFAINDTFGYTERHLNRIIKSVANRAKIKRPVSAHVPAWSRDRLTLIPAGNSLAGK